LLWRGLLLLCGQGLGCCARLFDFRHDFADFYFLTFGGFGFEHAISFSNDFSRNFVGLESEERIAFFYLLARFLVPDGNDTAGNRLADGGNFHLHAHCAAT
jgi:hypothetical protein